MPVLKTKTFTLKPRLHDTTCCQTGLITGQMFAYTIQPVESCIQTFNWLTNGLTTGLTNGCIVYTAGCQTGCTTRFYNQLNEQLFVQPVVIPGLRTGWTNSGCSFNTVVKPVVKPGCTTGFKTVLKEQSVRSTRLSNGCIVYTHIQPVVKLVW